MIRAVKAYELPGPIGAGVGNQFKIPSRLRRPFRIFGGQKKVPPRVLHAIRCSITDGQIQTAFCAENGPIKRRCLGIRIFMGQSQYVFEAFARLHKSALPEPPIGSPPDQRRPVREPAGCQVMKRIKLPSGIKFSSGLTDNQRIE